MQEAVKKQIELLRKTELSTTKSKQISVSVYV